MPSAATRSRKRPRSFQPVASHSPLARLVRVPGDVGLDRVQAHQPRLADAVSPLVGVHPEVVQRTRQDAVGSAVEEEVVVADLERHRDPSPRERSTWARRSSCVASSRAEPTAATRTPASRNSLDVAGIQSPGRDEPHLREGTADVLEPSGAEPRRRERLEPRETERHRELHFARGRHTGKDRDAALPACARDDGRIEARRDEIARPGLLRHSDLLGRDDRARTDDSCRAVRRGDTIARRASSSSAVCSGTSTESMPRSHAVSARRIERSTPMPRRIAISGAPAKALSNHAARVRDIRSGSRPVLFLRHVALARRSNPSWSAE